MGLAGGQLTSCSCRSGLHFGKLELYSLRLEFGALEMAFREVEVSEKISIGKIFVQLVGFFVQFVG